MMAATLVSFRQRLLDKSKGTRSESEWFYECEMRKQFGKKDWNRMKAKGIFMSEEDEDMRGGC
jgi:hypothetical protein